MTTIHTLLHRRGASEVGSLTGLPTIRCVALKITPQGVIILFYFILFCLPAASGGWRMWMSNRFRIDAASQESGRRTLQRNLCPVCTQSPQRCVRYDKRAQCVRPRPTSLRTDTC